MAADKEKPKQPASPEQPPMRPGMDDDVVGKAYDSRLMRRLGRYLTPYKLAASVSAVAILLKSVSDVSGPYFVKVAVDTYFAPSGPPGWLGRRLSRDPLTGVTELGLIYLGALLFSFGLEFVQTYLMQWTGQKIMFDLRSQIFRHIQSMHVGFFDRNPVGRLVTRVTSDVDALNEMFTSGVLAIFEDVFTLSFIVGIMLWMSWPLALLALAVIPVILYATKLFREHVRDSYRRQRAATAKINSFTQEYVSGMSVVQLFNRERRAFRDFSAVNAENKRAWTDAIFAYALYYPVVEFLSSIAIALVIWRGGLAVLNASSLTWLTHHRYLAVPGAAAHLSILGNTITIGILIAFIQYAQRFFRPIQDLSDKYNILQAAMAAAERIFKLLDTPPDITAPAHPRHGDRSGRIEFRHVWFTYQHLTPEQTAALTTLTANLSSRPESSQFDREDAAERPLYLSSLDAPTNPLLDDIEWILRDVSFIIDPNTTAAIVGHTGAGKTTLTALMMRFYDVQRGHVLVDGVDVREQDLLTLRRRFGVVLQDPFLFSGDIRYNIRLGSSWITEDEVANAADQVNVGDFIRTLPAQFAEPVLERGSTLSTGQKQLISFARALAHQPGILILDEATSSVDTETEQLVSSALARMITGRTSVVIAHRLSTVQRADTILVMHKGKLREQGTHQQLLAHRGLYYKLYQLQYRDQESPTLGTSLSETATA
ncbi:MAG TPA: ABC transporter ATP-binding protein [Acidobacteriaceae bacterium]|jgi:ATP-binding cassette subfamily B protein|nr:ABC transporter ATP-binding protein [Acidobacteriaceae bacterium]